MEQVKKEINFQDLKCMVCESVKNNDASFIEAIKDENQLRYVQKLIEVLISRRGSIFSYQSFLIGIDGIGLAFMAIGISFVLAGISAYISTDVSKIIYTLNGFIILYLGMWIGRRRKEFKNIEKDTEFMHEISLRIEEKLLK